MHKLWLVFVIVFFSLQGFAVEYEKTSATAIAATQDKAISKALAQAVGQVNGAAVAQQVDIRETAGKVYMGYLGQTVEIPGGEINVGYSQNFSKGIIRRYSVKSVEFLKDQSMYKVTVDAEVQSLGDFKNIGADRSQLIPLVVAPLQAGSASYESLNGPVPAREVVGRITDELSRVLTQSNQFRVLDRANLGTLLSEDFVTQALGQRTGQQVKFSQKLSADVVVVGSIRQFSISNRAVESYGQQYEHYEGEMVLDVRAIETATGELRFAQRFEEYLDHRQIQDSLQRLGGNIFDPSQKTDKRRVQYAIESLLVEQIGTAIVQAFYPDYQPTAAATPASATHQPDAKTPLSDAPGSSDKPWNWNE